MKIKVRKALRNDEHSNFTGFLRYETENYSTIDSYKDGKVNTELFPMKFLEPKSMRHEYNWVLKGLLFARAK